MLDPYYDDVTMDDPDTLGHDGPATIAGPSGITVVPKAKAKRYENSVCHLSQLKVIHADFFSPGCAFAHIPGLARPVS